MNSIHCYSRREEDINRSDVNKETPDDQPIVIVGTRKDALNSDVEKVLKFTNFDFCVYFYRTMFYFSTSLQHGIY